ncbi:MAG: elongation factor P maturation arginine rhamnosyltransferase EarP, partial [Methyloversatilis sp.]|nr:elongation factor P maturation arginine rhamnosyltransferase EarP [Methyloversatilis sp.]
MSHPVTTDSSRNTPPLRPDCDLFCRVVDNLGDIGVCWRLARCLARDHGWRVRLWVDVPEALARIKPHGCDEPRIAVMRWSGDLPAGCVPAPMVIEAFACALPQTFVAAMAALGVAPRWINLEYLSAETWVEDCHRLPSRDAATGLPKHFFFPGFTLRTGGLLREHDLLARRDAWRADAMLRRDTFERLGMQPRADALQMSLFSYESRAIATLVEALSAWPRPVQLWVPEGRVLSSLTNALGQPLSAGLCAISGSLEVGVLPFMDQDDYDALLWHCDVNAVRGEDSFVRAQWAARPMLWHIYAQEDDAHLAKLDAFLERYAEGLDASVAARLRALHRGWNGVMPVRADDWRTLLVDLTVLTPHAQRWA